MRSTQVTGTGIAMLILLAAALYGESLTGFKLSATLIVFMLVLVQVIAGVVVYRHALGRHFRSVKTYHRVAGYVIIGIYIAVSTFCILLLVPSVGKYADLRVMLHMALGTAGYVAFPLKLFWVKRKNGYSRTTVLLGIIFATIVSGIFATTVLRFPA